MSTLAMVAVQAMAVDGACFLVRRKWFKRYPQASGLVETKKYESYQIYLSTLCMLSYFCLLGLIESREYNPEVGV